MREDGGRAGWHYVEKDQIFSYYKFSKYYYCPIIISQRERFPKAFFVKEAQLSLEMACQGLTLGTFISQSKGHHFVSTHYTSLTFCNHCNGLLWGIGDQGYQCSSK